MNDPLPSKPAVSIYPGEYVIEDDTRHMVLGVTYEPSRDHVTLKLANRVKEYRMSDLVCFAPGYG